MVESSAKINKNSNIPIYLVVGDSGAGKSSFINYLMGGKVAPVDEENPGGESTTQECDIYTTSTSPLMHLVDTQGTNDTKNPDNNSVLLSIMHKFLRSSDFVTHINGLIYLHDSNNTDRFHFDVRCK